MYFNMSKGTQKVSLQWFPFSIISAEEKKEIASEEFYNKNIRNFSFLLYPQTIHQSENFMQKSDGSFRDSSLISPILYLILQALGKEIYNVYTSKRTKNITVYYAGNYKFLRPKYKQDYDDFFKDLNSSIEKYQYFIKTDITSFFPNINVDKLINMIDKVCNKKEQNFSQTQLQLIKEFLLFCGSGRFPLIENSIASSYLSTVIYLDEVDFKLGKYLDKYESIISSYKIVRYVDDMYILISSDKQISYLKEAYNEIRNQYSSILKEYGLALNTKKCCLRASKDINIELKKSLYDEYFNGEKSNIEDLFKGALSSFLQELSFELLFDSVSIDDYNNLIEKHFSSDDIEFTANEVFNYFVYENEEEICKKEVVSQIICLVKQSISFVSLDPKRLTVMIMKTKEDKAIKAFLNQLFSRNRAEKWNSYDTTIAITYLIQSKFQHIDLLNILNKQHPDLHRYYSLYCKNSFLKSFNLEKVKKLQNIIKDDHIALYLLFLYLSESKKENIMGAFAYYKSFFDRVTADIDFVCGENRLKKPNYKAFYKEGPIKTFYKNIEGSKEIIENAYALRHANPLSHSSAELLRKNNSSKELKICVEQLTKLIYKYIVSL